MSGMDRRSFDDCAPLTMRLFYLVAYATLVPLVGLLVRLSRSQRLNDAVTLLYTALYWLPLRLLNSLLMRWRHGDRRLVFRDPGLLDAVAKPGSYTYDRRTDIYRSAYVLDDRLQEWGSVEYLPFVYDTIAYKYHNVFNFKQLYFEPAKAVLEASAGRRAFRILDIGPGTGNSTVDVLNVFKNATVCCLDISDKLLARARARCPECYFFKGTMEDTGFLDGAFDIVLNLGGINEADVAASIRETWRVARPGALMIVGDENFDATSYWQKIRCVLKTNLSFIDSYKYDGQPTRPPKPSLAILDEFFLTTHRDECAVLSRNVSIGLLYHYVVRKHPTA